MSTPPSSRWSTIAVSATVVGLALSMSTAAHEVAVPGPAEWKQAQERARAAKFLPPDEAVGVMTVPPGFRASLFAAEPMISQPFAFCFDAKGRMWIAENRDYETRGRGFSNDGRSRIVILEDTDHNGTADSRKVFLEGIPFPSAIAVGFGGLWLGAPPIYSSCPTETATIRPI